MQARSCTSTVAVITSIAAHKITRAPVQKRVTCHANFISSLRSLNVLNRIQFLR